MSQFTNVSIRYFSPYVTETLTMQLPSENGWVITNAFSPMKDFGSLFQPNPLFMSSKMRSFPSNAAFRKYFLRFSASSAFIP